LRVLPTRHLLLLCPCDPLCCETPHAQQVAGSLRSCRHHGNAGGRYKAGLESNHFDGDMDLCRCAAVLSLPSHLCPCSAAMSSSGSLRASPSSSLRASSRTALATAAAPVLDWVCCTACAHMYCEEGKVMMTIKGTTQLSIQLLLY
jgi:hypothetical protein